MMFHVLGKNSRTKPLKSMAWQGLVDTVSLTTMQILTWRYSEKIDFKTYVT